MKKLKELIVKVRNFLFSLFKILFLTVQVIFMIIILLLPFVFLNKNLKLTILLKLKEILFKRNKNVDNKYEEINEKKTAKMVYKSEGNITISNFSNKKVDEITEKTLNSLKEFLDKHGKNN